MKRSLVTAAVALTMLLMSAVPAMASTEAADAAEYGLHHAEHAIEMGGFTGDHNPGVKHRGFSGWQGM